MSGRESDVWDTWAHIGYIILLEHRKRIYAHMSLKDFGEALCDFSSVPEVKIIISNLSENYKSMFKFADGIVMAKYCSFQVLATYMKVASNVKKPKTSRWPSKIHFKYSIRSSLEDQSLYVDGLAGVVSLLGKKMFITFQFLACRGSVEVNTTAKFQHNELVMVDITISVGPEHGEIIIIIDKIHKVPVNCSAEPDADSIPSSKENSKRSSKKTFQIYPPESSTIQSSNDKKDEAEDDIFSSDESGDDIGRMTTSAINKNESTQGAASTQKKPEYQNHVGTKDEPFLIFSLVNWLLQTDPDRLGVGSIQIQKFFENLDVKYKMSFQQLDTMFNSYSGIFKNKGCNKFSIWGRVLLRSDYDVSNGLLGLGGFLAFQSVESNLAFEGVSRIFSDGEAIIIEELKGMIEPTEIKGNYYAVINTNYECYIKILFTVKPPLSLNFKDEFDLRIFANKNKVVVTTVIRANKQSTIKLNLVEGKRNVKKKSNTNYGDELVNDVDQSKQKKGNEESSICNQEKVKKEGDDNPAYGASTDEEVNDALTVAANSSNALIGKETVGNCPDTLKNYQIEPMNNAKLPCGAIGRPNITMTKDGSFEVESTIHTYIEKNGQMQNIQSNAPEEVLKALENSVVAAAASSVPSGISSAAPMSDKAPELKSNQSMPSTADNTENRLPGAHRPGSLAAAAGDISGLQPPAAQPSVQTIQNPDAGNASLGLRNLRTSAGGILQMKRLTVVVEDWCPGDKTEQGDFQELDIVIRGRIRLRSDEKVVAFTDLAGDVMIKIDKKAAEHN